MRKAFLTAATLTAVLAAAPLAFAQSGAQTGAMGTGGSTSNQTGAANGSTGNPAAPMPTTQDSAAQSGNTNPGQTGQAQQLSQSDIENVQQHLQQQGYYKNAQVDGRWGPHTRQAVESFQQAKGLPATGHLDQQTLNALGLNQGG